MRAFEKCCFSASSIVNTMPLVSKVIHFVPSKRFPENIANRSYSRKLQLPLHIVLFFKRLKLKVFI